MEKTVQIHVNITKEDIEKLGLTEKVQEAASWEDAYDIIEDGIRKAIQNYQLNP